MPEELIDIYDEEMNLLGTATRSQAHREGLWHTSFHCWITRRSPEGRPQVLLQIRGKTQNHPSLIDISSAGHLTSGEKPRDGIKNIEKELGLKVDFNKLIKLFTTSHVFQKNNYINHEFNPTYLLEDNTALSDYNLNPDLVEGVFIADVEDVLNLFKHKVDKIYVSGLRLNEQRLFVPHAGNIARCEFVPHTDQYFAKVMETIQRYFVGQHNDNPTYP